MTMNDRNYYRMMDADELVQRAKETQQTELEIALTERLEDALKELEGQYYDRLADRQG